MTTRQRRARPVLPAAPPAPPAPAPTPAPAPPPPPEPQPTLVRGHAERTAAQVREAGTGTPAQPVTDLAASTVETVAELLP